MRTAVASGSICCTARTAALQTRCDAPPATDTIYAAAHLRNVTQTDAERRWQVRVPINSVPAILLVYSVACQLPVAAPFSSTSC